MSKRFTITEKWEDLWFSNLKPNEKLLWNYLCDKCDLAGFWEINLDLACFQTKIPKKSILGAFQGLSRGYFENGKHIWLRTFVRHQANYPLNPKNNAHKHIIGILQRHVDDFVIDFYEELNKNSPEKVGAVQGLSSSPGKGNSNSKGNSSSKEPPSLKEIQEYITSKGYTVNAETFLDYFTESNWVDSKGNKVLSWKQKIITWNSKENNNGTGQKPTTGNGPNLDGQTSKYGRSFGPSE